MRMIDVGDKPVTKRAATATAFVHLAPVVLEHIRAGTLPKGDVLAVSRITAVTAAKQTPTLLPLCHPLPLSKVEPSVELEADGVRIVVTCETTAQTGVEMEALTAASAAALCVYDMTKGIDPTGSIEDIKLLKKSGGKSGHWERA